MNTYSAKAASSLKVKAVPRLQRREAALSSAATLAGASIMCVALAPAALAWMASNAGDVISDVANGVRRAPRADKYEWEQSLDYGEGPF